MWYNLDIKKLGVLLLPTFWRQPRMLAFVQSLLAPLIKLHDDFVQNRHDNIYKMQHNGQVCFLEAALNDRFDSEQRLIEIVDANSYARQYLYTRGEQQPRYLGTIYLYDRSDYADTGVDFIVLVPQSLSYNPYEMHALVDFYKLASKRYKIVKQ